MVIDRLQLYIFFFVTTAGTVGILMDAPHIFEYVDQDKIIENYRGKWLDPTCYRVTYTILYVINNNLLSIYIVFLNITITLSCKIVYKIKIVVIGLFVGYFYTVEDGQHQGSVAQSYKKYRLLT